MFLSGDAKGLEWICVNWLAQDQVGMQEILSGVDQHALNQERFGLPTRVIAKVFVFRLIYGGMEYSYAHDPDFQSVSTSPKFWREVIDLFYDKYQGIAKYHDRLMQEATSTGRIVMPTGRFYDFKPYLNKRGEPQWPRTKILNYPVQGLAADLMTIMRVSFRRRLDNLDKAVRDCIMLVSTVHDSVVVDILDRTLEELVRSILVSVFDDLPSNFQRIFNIDFNLPLRVEITIGPNLKDMT